MAITENFIMLVLVIYTILMKCLLPIDIRLFFQVYFILVPVFECITEKPVIIKIQFAVYNFKGLGINTDFITV